MTMAMTVYDLQQTWHSFNNCLNSGWMRKMCEMHLTDLIDFSFFFYCKWNALVQCAFILRTSRRNGMGIQEASTRYFRCRQYESGVNRKCISKWFKTNENERKNCCSKKWQLVWVFMIDVFLLLWIYHILWHTYYIYFGCVHFMMISLLEMFQIVLINCMFAHLNGWILQ